MKKILFCTLFLGLLLSCGSGSYQSIGLGEEGNLSTIYSWIKNVSASDVDYVMSYHDNGTISPSIYNCYNTFRIDNEEAKIEQIINKLSSLKVAHKEHQNWYGGTQNSLTIYLKNGSYHTLSSNNGSFVYEDNYYEYVNGSLPSCSNYYGSKFVLSTYSMPLYYNDTLVEDIDSKSTSEFLSKVIFYTSSDIEYEIDEKYEGYSFKLSSADSIQEAKIISDKEFLIVVDSEVKYVCNIVNDMSFADLIKWYLTDCIFDYNIQ